jgi:hypothetical protein
LNIIMSSTQRTFKRKPSKWTNSDFIERNSKRVKEPRLQIQEEQVPRQDLMARFQHLI